MSSQGMMHIEEGLGQAGNPSWLYEDRLANFVGLARGLNHFVEQ
jgi:hypothetical protein